MIKTTHLVLAVLAAALAPGAKALPPPPPANDNFANALTIVSGGTSTVDGTFATSEPREPDHFTYGGATHAAHSVWWKFTAPYNGYVQFDSRGSAYGTALSVYTGSALSALTRIAQDDVSGSLTTPRTSLVRISVTKGVVYRIAVDGLLDAPTGSTTLTVSPQRINEARIYQAVLFGSSPKDDNGILTLTTTTSTTITGSLRLGAGIYPFTGAVDVDNNFFASVTRPGRSAASVRLTMGSNLAGAIYGPAYGTVKVGENSYAAQAYPVAVFTTASPCPRKGRYVQAIQNAGAVGYGVSSSIVSPTGVMTTLGWLADGTAFAMTARVLDNTGNLSGNIDTRGSICYHLPLYGGQGQITGAAHFDATASPTALGGDMQWYRPAPREGVAFLPSGINGSLVSTFGNLYTPPAPTHRVDPIFDNAPVGSSGHAELDITALDYPSFNKSDLFLNTSNVFSYGVSNGNLVRLTVSTATGLLAGSVKLVNPFPGHAPINSTIRGVVINYPTYPRQFYGFATSISGTAIATVHP